MAIDFVNASERPRMSMLEKIRSERQELDDLEAFFEFKAHAKKEKEKKEKEAKKGLTPRETFWVMLGVTPWIILITNHYFG